MQTIGAGLTGHWRGLVVLAIAAAVLSGCGGGSMLVLPIQPAIRYEFFYQAHRTADALFCADFLAQF